MNLSLDLRFNLTIERVTSFTPKPASFVSTVYCLNNTPNIFIDLPPKFINLKPVIDIILNNILPVLQAFV